MLYALLFTHWLADFVFQTNWMATNKSKNWWALSSHVGVYTLCFLIFGWKFALLNGGIHFGVDAVTSRVTSKLWERKDVHNFFVVVGLDQLVHMSCLIATAGMI